MQLREHTEAPVEALQAQQPHWHLIGAGAIGCLLAKRLAQAKRGPTLVLRTAPAQPEVTVRCDSPGQTSSVSVAATGAANAGPITHLIVTTKAYDVAAAVASIAAALAPTATVLIVTNGMGLADEVRRIHPGAALACGITTEGVYRHSAFTIEHTGLGDTRIGSPGGGAALPWFDRLQQSIPRCFWETQIDSAQWHKLAINCAINPLTAVHRCSNGELAHSVQLRDQVQLLCKELAQVSYAAGYTDTAREIAQATERVITATAANRSSMLQDVMQQRPTEIDYITGYLLQVAQTHGIPAPHNKRLFEAVKALER